MKNDCWMSTDIIVQIKYLCTHGIVQSEVT